MMSQFACDTTVTTSLSETKPILERNCGISFHPLLGGASKNSNGIMIRKGYCKNGSYAVAAYLKSSKLYYRSGGKDLAVNISQVKSKLFMTPLKGAKVELGSIQNNTEGSFLQLNDKYEIEGHFKGTDNVFGLWNRKDIADETNAIVIIRAK